LLSAHAFIAKNQRLSTITSRVVKTKRTKGNVLLLQRACVSIRLEIARCGLSSARAARESIENVTCPSDLGVSPPMRTTGTQKGAGPEVAMPLVEHSIVCAREEPSGSIHRPNNTSTANQTAKKSLPHPRTRPVLTWIGAGPLGVDGRTGNSGIRFPFSWFMTARKTVSLVNTGRRDAVFAEN
jgi:hypothetical protein